jgi:hypothetical protein
MDAIETPDDHAKGLGADIVNSPDDGGWYASMFRWDPSDAAALPQSFGRASPTFGSKPQAEAWARKRGATVLLYP